MIYLFDWPTVPFTVKGLTAELNNQNLGISTQTLYLKVKKAVAEGKLMAAPIGPGGKRGRKQNLYSVKP